VEVRTVSSVEQLESIGGAGFLGVPVFELIVSLLDNYARGELLMELHGFLPRWLTNPAFAFVCVFIGLGLLYRAHQHQLRRILSAPATLVNVEEYRRKEKPGWLVPFLWVLLFALIAPPCLAVLYTLSYKGTAPPLSKLQAPAICKTDDCYPHRRIGPNRNVSTTVINAVGGIPIVGNRGTVVNPTVNNLTTRPDPPFEWLTTNERSDEVLVTITVKGVMDLPAFMAICDRACESVSATTDGFSLPNYYSNQQHPEVTGIGFAMPTTVLTGTKIIWHIQSLDRSQLSIKALARLPADKLPPRKEGMPPYKPSH
jgi:hypothetical protein